MLNWRTWIYTQHYCLHLGYCKYTWVPFCHNHTMKKCSHWYNSYSRYNTVYCFKPTDKDQYYCTACRRSNNLHTMFYYSAVSKPFLIGSIPSRTFKNFYWLIFCSEKVELNGVVMRLACNFSQQAVKYFTTATMTICTSSSWRYLINYSLIENTKYAKIAVYASLLLEECIISCSVV